MDGGDAHFPICVLNGVLQFSLNVKDHFILCVTITNNNLSQTFRCAPTALRKRGFNYHHE